MKIVACCPYFSMKKKPSKTKKNITFKKNGSQKNKIIVTGLRKVNKRRPTSSYYLNILTLFLFKKNSNFPAPKKNKTYTPLTTSPQACTK